MLGRRNREGRVAYPEEQDLRRKPQDDHDEPEHHEGPIHRLDEHNEPVHRLDEGDPRPANIDGTPPGATPLTERDARREEMPKPGPDLVVERTVTARGMLMLGPVITGVVVAFGAMAILTAFLTALFVVSDTTAAEATRDSAIPIGVGVLLVLTQFAAYYWGGYTAGRMARGSGVLNGLAVPLVALLIAFGTGLVLSLMGADFNLNVPVAGQSLNVSGDTVWQIGIGLGIASLIAMTFGGIVGGMRGANWHGKLEAGRVRGAHREDI